MATRGLVDPEGTYSKEAAIREHAQRAVLEHYKVAGIGGMVMNAGRGLLNAGRAAHTAVKGIVPLAEGVAGPAQSAMRTGWDAFRGAGGLRHAGTIGMGVATVGGGAMVAGAGLRASGVMNQQPQQQQYR